MKYLLLTMTLLFAILLANGQELKYNWLLQIGGPDWDIVTDLTETPDGQILALGTFYNTITVTNKILESKGSRDVFIAGFDKDGNLNKAIAIGGEGYDYAKRIAVSSESELVIPIKFYKETEINGKQFKGNLPNNFLLSWFDQSFKLYNYSLISSSKEFDITNLSFGNEGELYFSGWFSDTLLVDNKKLISDKQKDVFFGKISSKGKLSWLKHFKGEGDEVANAMVTLSEEETYLAGQTITGCFGKENIPQNISADNGNLFIAQADAQGKIKNVTYPVSGPGFELIDMLVDSTDIWLLGNFSNSLLLPNDKELTASGRSDVFVLKYNLESGSVIPYQLGGKGRVGSNRLLSSGNQLFIIGDFTGNLFFGEQNIKSSGKGSDVFIAGLDKKTERKFIYSLPGNNKDFPCASFASERGIYIAGEFRETIKLNNEMVSSGKEDIFLAALVNCNTDKPLSVSIDPVGEGSLMGWDLDAGNGYVEYTWDGTSTGSRYYYASEPGTYLLEVEDSLGCIYSSDIIIGQTKSGSIPNDGLLENEDEDLKISQDFNIYPTVTNDMVYWEPASSWGDGKVTVSIYDPAGRQIQLRTINQLVDNRYSLNLGSYTEGTYVIEIMGNGFRETSKVILKK